jgi:hypothetical protein
VKKHGNPEALKAGADKREIATHNALVEAYNRLERGEPTVVKKGTLITPSSVAREAGVDRGVLYGKHRDILDKIQQTKIERKAGLVGPKRKRHVKDVEARLDELRGIVDILQKEKRDIATALASSHLKSVRLQNDLDRVVKERDYLKQQLTKVRPLHSVDSGKG